MKRTVLFSIFVLSFSLLSALPFNKNLSEEDLNVINSGEVLIKNINYAKYMSLEPGTNDCAAQLISLIKGFNPKYLAEVIQVKPYEGNEDLPERLTSTLYNVSDYAGIPYWSEHSQKWFNLYDSAEILSEEEIENGSFLKALLIMQPFNEVYEDIQITSVDDSVLYVTTNTNKLNYKGKFDCVWPNKMKMCILLFRDGDNWILYGIGGVNAPRIPMFTERIQTSFINRINTFCSFIFKKF